MIIILGSNTDAHTTHIARALKNINEDYVFLDTRQYPYNVLINWHPDSQDDGNIVINGKSIKYKDIKSVYWRNFFGVKNEIIEDGENTTFLSDMIKRERESALNSLFYSLKINWVNSIKAFELHKTKAYQTNIIHNNGIRVPRTLITNDKESVYKFFEENNQQIICKPILGGAYTEKITKDSLTKERLDVLNVAPVQFQEYIDGVDIRVYGFKDILYPIRIETDVLDFRRDKEAKLIPCELPKEIQENCIKAMKLLDLKYTGIDLRLKENGEYVFIEANPAPMFIYAEKMTGFPFTESLIKLLINE